MSVNLFTFQLLKIKYPNQLDQKVIEKQLQVRINVSHPLSAFECGPPMRQLEVKQFIQSEGFYSL